MKIQLRKPSTERGGNCVVIKRLNQILARDFILFWWSYSKRLDHFPNKKSYFLKWSQISKVNQCYCDKSEFEVSREFSFNLLNLIYNLSDLVWIYRVPIVWPLIFFRDPVHCDYSGKPWVNIESLIQVSEVITLNRPRQAQPTWAASSG